MPRAQAGSSCLLIGVAGNDSFVYTLVSDSAVTGQDTIDGVDGIGSAGGDGINLATIEAITASLGMDDAFTFIGNAVFSAADRLKVVTTGIDT